MTSTTRFFVRSALRVFQLFCLLFVPTAIAQVPPLIAAFNAVSDGTMKIPEFCWKLLAVTGPLIPSVIILVAVELLLRLIKAPTHPVNEPWLANPMWAAKHIRLNNRGLLAAMLVSMLFYFGIAVPFSIATEKTPFMVFCGAFGLVLLGMARVFWLNRKWNTAELRMADVPGLIGGPFSGVVVLKQAFPPGNAFGVCLKCQKTTTYRSSGDSGSSSKIDTVWSSTIYIDKTLPSDAPNRTLLPFGFAIPYECEPTSDWNSESSSSTMWNLVVNQKDAVSMGGAVFKVPIYRTSESRIDFKLDEEFIQPFQQDVDVEKLLQRFRMTREPLPGGATRLAFSVWNGKMFNAILALTMVCLAIVVACFWFIPHRIGASFAALFPGLFFFAGWYAIIDMVFWRCTVEIARHELRCESGLFGFRKSLVTLKTAQPKFVTVFDFSKENGEWYRVELHAPDPDNPNDPESVDTLVLINRLDGRAEADAFRDWLTQQCDLSSVPESDSENPAARPSLPPP